MPRANSASDGSGSTQSQTWKEAIRSLAAAIDGQQPRVHHTWKASTTTPTAAAGNGAASSNAWSRVLSSRRVGAVHRVQRLQRQSHPAAPACGARSAIRSATAGGRRPGPSSPRAARRPPLPRVGAGAPPRRRGRAVVRQGGPLPGVVGGGQEPAPATATRPATRGVPAASLGRPSHDPTLADGATAAPGRDPRASSGCRQVPVLEVAGCRGPASGWSPTAGVAGLVAVPGRVPDRRRPRRQRAALERQPARLDDAAALGPTRLVMVVGGCPRAL